MPEKEIDPDDVVVDAEVVDEERFQQDVREGYGPSGDYDVPSSGRAGSVVAGAAPKLWRVRVSQTVKVKAPDRESAEAIATALTGADKIEDIEELDPDAERRAAFVQGAGERGPKRGSDGPW